MKIKTRRYHIYYYGRILFFLIGILPRKVGLAFASFLGGIAFSAVPKYRNIAVDNLDRALGGDHGKNVRIARDVFRNLGKNGTDWIKCNRLSKQEVVDLVTETEGIEHLDRSLSKGKGVIILASHFGNWELVLAYLRLKGYNGTVVARRIYFHKYDDLINGLRKKFDIQIAYRDESPKKILKLLKDGGMLGMLADQDVDSVEGVFVDFFNRPAYTPTAPVKLGMTAGSDIVPVFMIRKKDDTFRFVVEEPISLVPEGDKEEDVRRYTQAWTGVLERYVREYPEQWAWIHRRWKTEE